jgi:hypothetical protein
MLSLPRPLAGKVVFLYDCLSRARLTPEIGVFLHVVVDGFRILQITTEKPALMRTRLVYETHEQHLIQAVFAKGECVYC